MDVKRSTIKGIVWSMMERFSTMGIQLLCTLVIAQFLTPMDFGVVSMMSIFLSFSSILVDSGFGQALIRKQSVTEEDYSSVFYFNIFLSIIIYVLGYIFSPLIADFYNEPMLTSLLRVSFLVMFCYGFSVVQQARLFKELNFSLVSKISLLSVILSGIVGIIMAYLLKNAWSLVLQALSLAFFRTVFMWIFSKWMPKLVFSWKSINKFLKFSLNLLGTNMIASITDNLASLFIGRAYNSTELGNYTVPNKIQVSVSGTISFSIHRVSYSVMSSFQDEIEKLRDYSQKIVAMAFFIIAPIMLFLLLESEDFFLIILNPKWLTAAFYFKFLCVIGMIFCFADINMDVLLVRGRSDIVFRIELVRKTIFVLLLLIGIRYSMIILLCLLIAYNVFNTILVSYFVGKEIKLSLWGQFCNIVPTVTTLMFSAVITLTLINYLKNYIARFSLSILVFFVSYIIFSYIFRNKSLFQVKYIINYLRHRH